MQPTISARRVAAIVGTGPWPSPAYATLASALGRAISDGRVPVGTRLPSERELTTAVGLSRTTTTRAYAELRTQGLLATRRGSGSVVQLPDIPGGRVDHLLAPAGLLDDTVDLTCTAPLSPPGLAEAYAIAIEQVQPYLAGTGYYPSGVPVLREQVARRYTERGLPTDPDQVIITSGALAAVAIAVRSLIRPRDRVLVESPTYANAIATLEGAGARLVMHPLDVGPASPEGPSSLNHGWDLDALATSVTQARSKAAYLIPDFHNPTGALLSASGRRALGRILRAAGVVPIIDESLVDLWLDEGTEMPAPLGVSVPDAVSVGSASKIFWGGLRIGWLRVPRARVDAMATSRLRLDLGAPVLEQLVVTELMRNGDDLLAGQRRRLRSARNILVDQLGHHLPDWRFAIPRGGLALWCELPHPRSTALATLAREHGLALASGPNFAPGGGLDGWLRVPFTVPEQQLTQVGPRLAAAWLEALAPGRPRSGKRSRLIA